MGGLAYVLIEVFQVLTDRDHELVGIRAVNDAVVVTQYQTNDVKDPVFTRFIAGSEKEISSHQTFG